jgi:hypothetical protein
MVVDRAQQRQRAFLRQVAVLAAMLFATPSLAVAATAGVFSLTSPAKVRGQDVSALPKVVPNGAVSAAVAMRINAALRREDARAFNAARDCRGSFREAQGRDEDPAWTRDVMVTMAGPRYLAYRVSDSYYCGGPYPNDGLRSDFVYDLATGAPVNWLRLFPKGAQARVTTSATGANLGVIAWRELTRRAAASAQPECRDVFADDGYDGFSIGLDARTGALTATPADLPHVIQACAEEMRLNGAALRQLGFAPELRAALAAAQRQSRAKGR